MKVFISYRRADSQFAAGRLDDFLASHFGRANVFFDVATLSGGTRFRDDIAAAVAKSDVVIPIIGPNWSSAADSSGRPRLSDPDDLVRVELESAIAARKRIIPVFLNQVQPLTGAVPATLDSLAELNSISLRPGRDFREDALSLIRHIVNGASPSDLLGRWHCTWSQTGSGQHAEDQEQIWGTEDVVEIYSVLGIRVFGRGLNFKQGAFELEGWWSSKCVSFVFSGIGDDEALKGTVTLKVDLQAERLHGLWAQYTESDGEVVGGPTVWTKMRN